MTLWAHLNILRDESFAPLGFARRDVYRMHMCDVHECVFSAELQAWSGQSRAVLAASLAELIH